MELKEFIKNVLIDISEGVFEAKAALKERDVLINPLPSSAYKGKRGIQQVDITVVVTVDDTKRGSSGIGIAKVVNVGLNKEKTEKESVVNTVRFSVPISLPVDSY